MTTTSNPVYQNNLMLNQSTPVQVSWKCVMFFWKMEATSSCHGQIEGAIGKVRAREANDSFLTTVLLCWQCGGPRAPSAWKAGQRELKHSTPLRTPLSTSPKGLFVRHTMLRITARFPALGLVPELRYKLSQYLLNSLKPTSRKAKWKGKKRATPKLVLCKESVIVRTINCI